MRITFNRFAFAAFILAIPVSFMSAQEKREPVTDRELIALIAGNSLSEDIAQEIASRGLAFHLSDQYRSLVSEAGGDARVLAALRSAKPVAGTEAAAETPVQLLQHLSLAGKLIRNKKYDEAVKELTNALKTGAGPETGFVMGGVLYQQEEWAAAAEVYAEILRQEPGFVPAHTKLSYVLFRLGDPEGGLREAKLVLAQVPNSAEAHRNAGVALDDLKKSSAAEEEYREALRIKPDYAVAHYDLGILYGDRKDWDRSIAEYKKSIALNPNDEKTRYNLANAYRGKGDNDSAIREYREAIRLNPMMLWAHQNLGNALMDRNMNAEAVLVFREMEKIAPDFAICHECLGSALFRTWDFQGAEKELRKAMEIDPTAALPHFDLGEIREEQKDYDAALSEFQQAEQLEPSTADAYRHSGRILLLKKDPSGAIKHLKQAEYLNPSNPEIHNLYGQALEASGNLSGAIPELKQAVTIDPKGAQFKLDLAAAFEKNEDWADAIDQYRQAGQADSSPAVQDKFKTAQARLNQHLAAMKASGKSADATALEMRIRATKTEPGISQKLDADMEAGMNALVARHPDEAEARFEEAVGLAEKLQPRDERLATALIRLSSSYAARNDFAKTESLLQRALAVDVEVYGAESPVITEPLQALGSYLVARNEFNSGLDYYLRAVDVNEKTFGESSDKVADSLRFVAHAYVAQQAYDKAEPYLLRAVHIDEALFGQNQAGNNAIALWELCDLYDKWNKPDKAASRYRQMLALLEKQYGKDSPVLLSTLSGEAKDLRQLGRTEDAANLERRIKSIRDAMRQAEGAELTPQQ
jgi:tetratricopeptide (TPR) repeat protein